MRPSPRSFAPAALAVALAALVATSSAYADVPACTGSDPGIASRQVADGKQHYRHALSQATVDVDEMRTALLEFEAACAAGDGMVLEPRAYALFALKRYVDAAESLDAFLKAHPLDTLPKDIHDRVVSQQSAILANVGTLHAVSDPPGAQVSIGGHPSGTAPVDIRLLPGAPVEVVVTLAGFETLKRTVTLEGKGVPHTETFAMRKADATLTIDAPEGSDVTIDGQPAGRTPLPPVKHGSGPVDVSVALPGGGPPITRHFDLAVGDDRVEHFGTDLPPPHETGSLTKWVYITGGTSIALLAAGVGFSVWRGNRTTTYDNACLKEPQPAGCSATLSQFDAAQASQITAFSLGGALAVTAVVLFVLDRKSSAAPAKPLSFLCVPGAGLSCSGTF